MILTHNLKKDCPNKLPVMPTKSTITNLIEPTTNLLTTDNRITQTGPFTLILDLAFYTDTDSLQLPYHMEWILTYPTRCQST